MQNFAPRGFSIPQALQDAAATGQTSAAEPASSSPARSNVASPMQEA
jgi:hypothetical protein